MKLTITLLICSFLLLSNAATLLAAGTKPKIEQQPSWVTPVNINYTAKHLDKDAEDGYSDLHFEQQVSLAQQAVFVKKTMHILSEAGVQNFSQVSVDYDPSFQQLSLHTIRIIRGNEVVNQLIASRIKTIQQEKELDRFIYNGSLTAVVILEDIRKDDIVEYSYTLKGFNPIFKNKYVGYYNLQYGYPLYNIYYRLVVPTGRTVNIKNSLTTIQPSISNASSETVYEWKIKDQESMNVEKDIPSWYDAFPMVMISEYNSWNEIAKWAEELFPLTPPSASLEKKINEIKTNHGTAEAKLLAALRFVQDDIRYMGIEMGENSHKPHSPSHVLQQRFGDCKDKSYLLCTMLKALGIESYPVLINTVYKKTINTWLPSHFAFDHVTVSVILDGKTYWFDPTIAYQRGSLREISYPNYQTGLIIKPGTINFTKIELQNPGKVATKESFFVKSLNSAVRLVVSTQFSGSFADNARYSFRSDSPKDIQESYKGLYTPYFKKITSDSISYEDDEATGVFRTKEYYTIKDFWRSEDGKQKVVLEPYLIGTIIKKPREENRRMPFSLAYPARYTEEIEINLPEDWGTSESSYDFKTSGCLLNYSYSTPSPDRVLLSYTYENTDDHILPASTSEYLEEIEKAEKTIAFEISDNINKRSVSKGFDTDSNKGFTIAYVILGCFAVGTYIYRSNQRRRNYWNS
jgi:transglutaminase-like putative cysteine protease